MDDNQSPKYLWNFTKRVFNEPLTPEKAREMLEEAREFNRKNSIKNKDNFMILLKILEVNCESKRQKKLLKENIDMYDKPLKINLEYAHKIRENTEKKRKRDKN